MAKDYNKLAEEIIEKVGGADNIDTLVNCMTRLRFQLFDNSKVDVKSLEQVEGVISVVKSGGQHQVVIGSQVAKVKLAIEEVSGKVFGGEVEKEESEENSGDKKNIFSRILNVYVSVVSAIFMPIMGAMAGAALLKAMVIMCSNFGWLSDESTTYTVLYAISDAFFYFLPVFLAFSAAEKFKANKFVSVIIASALIYPSILSLVGSDVTFIGIPLIVINYTSSVIPIIVSVFVQSKFEILLKKIIHQTVSFFLTPFLTLLIIAPLTFLVLGPVTSSLGDVIGKGIGALVVISPVITSLVLGFFWQIMILFGLHWGLVPIIINNLSVYGGDPLLPIVNGATFSMAGAVLAVWLITKNKKLKSIALPAFISAFLGGVTEPAIYGVTLKYKRPFIIACIVTGITGIPMALAGVMWPGIMSVNILTLPALFAIGGAPVLINSISAFILAFIVTYFFGFKDSMIRE